MSKIKNKNKKEIPEEDIVVKLKPLMGIKPGVYLTFLYAAVVLFILFILLVLPGLKNPGTLFKFETAPGNALVFVDGVYRGSTPCAVFVGKGTREMEIKKDFFSPKKMNVEVKGRIFFSLPFPVKRTINERLTLTDPDGFLAKRYRDIGGYALMRDFFDGYQYPNLIQRTVGEFQAGTGGNEKELYDFLYAMRFQFGNKPIVQDLAAAMRALSAVYKGMESDYGTLKAFYSDKSYSIKNLSLAYIKALLEKDRKEALLKDTILSEDYQKAVGAITEKKSVISPEDGKTVRISGINFKSIPSGTYTAGNFGNADASALLTDRYLIAFPHIEQVDGFYMMSSEVTVGEYERFLKDNPGWQKDSLEELKSKGFITDDYLFNYSTDDRSIPVSYVSWYAAQAFCKWMTDNLPENYRGKYEVKLPSEAQWEYAAELNSRAAAKKVFKAENQDGPQAVRFDRQGALGLYDLLGNVWEWNSNYYLPADTVFGRFGFPDQDNLFTGNERAVRGGSWANNADEISVTTRGSQNPSWCTPFLGFRAVMAKKVH